MTKSFDWYPHVTMPPDPLVDIETIAAVLGEDEFHIRAYLDVKCDFPVATYAGTELWLSDTLRVLLIEQRVARELKSGGVSRGVAQTMTVKSDGSIQSGNT